MQSDIEVRRPAAIERNKAIVLKFYGERDLKVQGDLLAPEFVGRAPGVPRFDRAGFLRGLAELYAAFPDGRYVNDNIVAEGDQVVTVGRFQGTHTGGVPRDAGHGEARHSERGPRRPDRRRQNRRASPDVRSDRNPGADPAGRVGFGVRERPPAQKDKSDRRSGMTPWGPPRIDQPPSSPARIAAWASRPPTSFVPKDTASS